MPEKISKNKDTHLVAIGKLSSPHGVKGFIKLFSYLEKQENFKTYKSFFFSDGSEVEVEYKFISKKFIIIALDGINNRNEVEEYIGKEIFIDRSELPNTKENELYNIDLIDCEVKLNGEIIGVVSSVNNFGAGDLLEIKFYENNKKQFFVLNDQNFPEINIENKIIHFNRPEEVTS